MRVWHSAGAVRNRTYQVGVKCLFIYLVYHKWTVRNWRGQKTSPLALSIMRYSTDLRKRVLNFVNKGGSKAEAERIYKVSRRTIYNWLASPTPFAYEKPGPKGPRLIDYGALQAHVKVFPDQTPAERAKHFGVSKDGIYYALGKLGIRRKKKFQV